MASKRKSDETDPYQTPTSKAPRASSQSSAASSTLTIRAEEADFYGLAVPRSFETGIALAIKILLSAEYEELFKQEVTDCNIDEFRQALQESYHIELFTHRVVVTAYCAVFRISAPTTIFFNPFLILNMLRGEAKQNNSPISQYELFIAAKLVHEFSHLLHFRCSAKLQGSL